MQNILFNENLKKNISMKITVSVSWTLLLVCIAIDTNTSMNKQIVIVER